MTPRDQSDERSNDDLAKAAEAFDQQLRERGDAEAPNNLANDRLRSVLELLNATLKPGSTKSQSYNGDISIRFEVPSRVGRFEVGPIVGKGGFGVVYRARDEVLHRDVALKAVPRKAEKVPTTNDDARLREARAVARLNHPNIVPLYEVLDDENCVYLISEFCEGPTLHEYLRGINGPLDPAKAAEITLRIAQAIAHAHDRGLVHRDIKPSNVLLMTERIDGDELPFTPRLTDFGLVLETDGELASQTPERLAGTVNFMSPEQILGDNRWDAKLSDVYSLGLLLFQMLAGKSAYKSVTPLALLEEICSKQIATLPTLEVPISIDLIAICRKAIQKDPSQRYCTAGELVDDLRRWKDGSEVSARKQSLFERLGRTIRREPVVSTLLAALMLLAIATVGIFAWSNQRLREQSSTLAQAYELASSSKTDAIKTAYRSDISRAFSAVARDDSAAALSILDQVDEYIDDTHRQRFDIKLLRTIAGRGWLPIASLPGAVEEVIHAPALNGFAVASESGGIYFYRESDGRPMAHYRHVGPGKIKALAISPDGKSMAVGRGIPRRIAWITTNDQQVVDIVSLAALTDTDVNAAIPLVVDWKATRTLTGFDATVDSLAYSGDGRYLAVGTRYEPINLFDLETEADREEFASERRNEDLSFSSNHQLAWMPTKTEISVSDVLVNKRVHQRTAPAKFELFRARQSRDGKWVMALLYHSGDSLLYPLSNDNESPVILETTDGEVRSVNFSDGSRYAVVGTAGGAVARWDLKGIAEQLAKEKTPQSESFRFKPEHLHGLHRSSVTSLAVSDQGTIMSGSLDGEVTLVNAEKLKQTNLTLETPDHSTCAIASSDGKKIYVGCSDGSISCILIPSAQRHVIHSADRSVVTRMALSSDDRWLAAGFNDGHAMICDMKHSPKWIPLPLIDLDDNSPKYVWEIAFNPAIDGLYINRGRCKCQWLQLDLPISDDESIRPKEKYFYHAPASLDSSVAVGNRNVMTFADTIFCFDIESGLHQALPGIHEVRSSCFDSMAQMILVGTSDGRIRMMNKNGQTVRLSEKWKPLESADDGAREITAITISSDGHNIITGSNLGDVGIWDNETLRYLGPILTANSQGPITTLQLVKENEKVIAFQQAVPSSKFRKQGAIHVISSQ